MTTHPFGAGNLPEPSAEAMAISRHLHALISERIADAGGAIPFESYMNAVLNEPGFGYYAANVRGFGPEADFVTAPEVSGAFAHSVAHAISPVLCELGADAGVLELGAGSGVLAERVLGSLAELSHLPPHYTILEPSPVLAAMQQERLEPLGRALNVSLHWLQRLPEPPLKGVILANEVVDAFPIERFQITPDGPRALYVEVTDGAFKDVPGPQNLELARWVSALEARLGRPLPPGYVSERNRLADAWVASLAQALCAGAAFVFDYGYEERDFYHPERVQGTLLCHYRHRAHSNPYMLPGLQDVTSSVDLSALARAAAHAGFSVAGYTTQAWFLMGNDLEGWMSDATPGTPDYIARAGAVRTLTMPGEMGERIKLMVLTKGIDDVLVEQTRDSRFRL